MSRPIYPICVKCQVAYKPKRDGVFVEVMGGGRGTLPLHRFSYQVFHGDLVECPNCGHQIVVGIGKNPVKQQFEDGYRDFLANIGKTYKCY